MIKQRSTEIPAPETKSPYIQPEIFRQVVEHTPLISIDFICVDQEAMLVGRRINRPAQGMFFVPGGRIGKGEMFEEAFKRVSNDELGITFRPTDCEALGIFDHIYPDSAIDPNLTTHYVALAYKVNLKLSDVQTRGMRKQHDKFFMMQLDEMLSSDDVHENTKVYARLL